MIRVDGLSYTYPGATAPAIRELTFAVEPGEVFGVLGPSGAGKSTTQNVLTGLLRGWTGQVELLVRAVGRTDRQSERGGVQAARQVAVL